MVLRQVFGNFERLSASMRRTELSEVLTSPKSSPGTGKHDAADRIILSGRFDSFCEFLQHERVNRVQHVGAVHGERNYAFILLNKHVLEISSHFALLLLLSSAWLTPRSRPIPGM